MSAYLLRLIALLLALGLATCAEPCQTDFDCGCVDDCFEPAP